jgi:hypothetical protein
MVQHYLFVMDLGIADNFKMCVKRDSVACSEKDPSHMVYLTKCFMEAHRPPYIVTVGFG